MSYSVARAASLSDSGTRLGYRGAEAFVGASVSKNNEEQGSAARCAHFIDVLVFALQENRCSLHAQDLPVQIGMAKTDSSYV